MSASLAQPRASLRHLDTNRYPMCSISLDKPPGLQLRHVSPAIVDTRGTYPFLLFRLEHAETGAVLHCVRGSASFPNDQAIERLYGGSLGAHFRVQVKGGGTIRFGTKSVQIYGASKTYGRSDHRLVGRLLKFCYPNRKVQYEPEVALTLRISAADTAATAAAADKSKTPINKVSLTKQQRPVGQTAV